MLSAKRTLLNEEADMLTDKWSIYYINDVARGVGPKQEVHWANVKSSPSEIKHSKVERERGNKRRKKTAQLVFSSANAQKQFTSFETGRAAAAAAAVKPESSCCQEVKSHHQDGRNNRGVRQKVHLLIHKWLGCFSASKTPTNMSEKSTLNVKKKSTNKPRKEKWKLVQLHQLQASR